MISTTTTLPMSKDSNGGRALAVTFTLALLLGACAPAAVRDTPSPSAVSGPTASPGPTKTPLPTLAAGMTRFTGTITDASNGYALSGVCVIIGPPAECLENMPHSDEHGVWVADLPVAGGGLSWTFSFAKNGYTLATRTGTSDVPGEKQIDIALQPK